MHVLKAFSADEALSRGLHYLATTGVKADSRNGPVLVAPGPVTTVYETPWCRVMALPERDANPFFHLFESLWIIAGRHDVRFLAYFNKKIIDYSDDKVSFHAPYGYRLREAQDFDQIDTVLGILRKNPESRQAVLQIWDAKLDLDQSIQTLDRPCNDLIFLSASGGKLDMLVSCRSNDVIWGAYGANIVQFSVLQEYLAAKIGIEVGTYHQMSFNYHVYVDLPFYQAHKAKAEGWTYPSFVDPYQHTEAHQAWVPTALFTPQNIFHVLDDMRRMFSTFDRWDDKLWVPEFLKAPMHSKVFANVVGPMLSAWHAHKTEGPRAGLDRLNSHIINGDRSDWLMAGREWLERRVKKEGAK